MTEGLYYSSHPPLSRSACLQTHWSTMADGRKEMMMMMMGEIVMMMVGVIVMMMMVVGVIVMGVVMVMIFWRVDGSYWRVTCKS